MKRKADAYVETVSALGRRRQAEPERRDAHLGRDAVDARRQVVTLVEDDEAEAVPHPLHEAEGRGVGRDGQRAHFKVAAADQTHFGVEAGEQEVVPLIHQIERRHDDQRRALHLLNRHLRNEALARARR